MALTYVAIFQINKSWIFKQLDIVDFENIFIYLSSFFAMIIYEIMHDVTEWMHEWMYAWNTIPMHHTECMGGFVITNCDSQFMYMENLNGNCLFQFSTLSYFAWIEQFVVTVSSFPSFAFSSLFSPSLFNAFQHIHSKKFPASIRYQQDESR